MGNFIPWAVMAFGLGTALYHTGVWRGRIVASRAYDDRLAELERAAARFNVTFPESEVVEYETPHGVWRVSP